MSKFTKKKSTKIVHYDKCPSLPLLTLANSIAKENYGIDDPIKSVYIVDDIEGRIVYKGNALYVTSQFMIDSIQTFYGINLQRNQYDTIEPKQYKFENKETNDVYDGRNHQQNRNSYGYGHRKDTPSINTAFQALDILFYMKERGKTCITASTDVNFDNVDRYQRGIKTNRNGQLNVQVLVPFLISERLEFTRMQNELLEFHKDSIHKCNLIRSCTNTFDLLDKHRTRVIKSTEKKVEDTVIDKISNLFLELGGQAYVS